MLSRDIRVLVAIALLSCLVVAHRAFGAVTIDFEGLGLERDPVTSLLVTDPVTGESVTVDFFVAKVFMGEGLRPILVQEGVQNGLEAGFGPEDTPNGEVPGNGNDWMLGNGIGIGADYIFTFTGGKVADISLDLIDFRVDGPSAGGTPGSDRATLLTFDPMGNQHPLIPAISEYTVPDPRPVDGNLVTLSSTATCVAEARLVFTPEGVDAGVAIDNLTFTVIPEPGLGSLIGTGVVVLGLLRRRNGLH